MFEIILVFILGLVLGSFANVCIYRMQRNLSIVKPNSHCTNCNNFIKWYDNIPILSYILLKGKCRYCKSKISLRYPLIEFICGLLFLSMYFLFGFSYILIPFCLFAFCLLVITVIDFDSQIIPDEISYFLIVLGLLVSPLNHILSDTFLPPALTTQYNIGSFNIMLGDPVLKRIISSVLGLIAGGGSLWLIGCIGKKIFGEEAMGGGDLKIMAGVGAFIGWDKVLFSIFLASLLGSIVGGCMILFKKIGRRDKIPFGPYLAISSFVMLFLPSPATIINYIFLFEENLLIKYVFTNLQNIR